MDKKQFKDADIGDFFVPDDDGSGLEDLESCWKVLSETWTMRALTYVKHEPGGGTGFCIAGGPARLCAKGSDTYIVLYYDDFVNIWIFCTNHPEKGWMKEIELPTLKVRVGVKST